MLLDDDLREKITRVINGPRVPALYSLAYIKYPTREVRIIQCANGIMKVFLARRGYEYKHRGPRPKNQLYIEAEELKAIFNRALAPKYSVLEIEVQNTYIIIRLKEN